MPIAVGVGPAPAPRPAKLLSRAEILASDSDRLERLGRHIIVGYQSFADLKALVDKRAIAGVFITDHNVAGHSAAEVRESLQGLQMIRADQALPPLIIAADQEGGTVSRLSPPLKRQPSLGTILQGLHHDDERERAVTAYADAQAAELNRIGVTMNFGPVVDLKFDPTNHDDGETQLRLRAIAADPYLVAKVAGWYCDALAKSHIMCTLKHFPGLGRVKRDTHVASAAITASEGQLELNDWVPFRRAMAAPNVVTMLGHVRVDAIDTTTPASFSQPVIDTVIRKRWQHDGLLVTDDFSMGAITRSRDGIGGAAIKALNSGVDLVLVSFSEIHYDTVMSALLEADANGEIDAKVGTVSRDRLVRILTPALDN